MKNKNLAVFASPQQGKNQSVDHVENAFAPAGGSNTAVSDFANSNKSQVFMKLRHAYNNERDGESSLQTRSI